MIPSAFAWVIASSGTWGSICCGFLVTLGVCRLLNGLEKQRRVDKSWWLFLATSRCFVRGSCASPDGAPKATLVDYAWLVWSPSCVGCVAPDCGFYVWCLLAHEPPSRWITTTGTSLPVIKWTLVKNHCVILSQRFLGIHCDWLTSSCDWLIPRHGGINITSPL